MKIKILILMMIVILSVAGCAAVRDVPKQLWGSSVSALERARTTAESRTFICETGDCFDAVLGLTKETEVVRMVKRSEDQRKEFMDFGPSTDEGYASVGLGKGKDLQGGAGTAAGDEVLKTLRVKTLDLFLQDRRRGRMVLMGVPGAVDTTEVGVFFTSMGDGLTRVEVSSLSSNAKLNAASIVFQELAARFPVQE